MALALLTAISMSASGPAWAAGSGQATVEKLVNVFTSWSGNPSDKKGIADADRYIDYNVMAERSLSSAEWGKLNAAQKKQFVDTLRTLIEQRYYVRWHKIFSKGKLIYQGESKSSGDEVVKSQLTVGKKVDPLDWRLSNDKVISLSVGKSDLLKKLSTRLEGRLGKLGFNGLLAWMKNKANIHPDESSSSS
jgi:ABC-type transporter MlaC component